MLKNFYFLLIFIVFVSGAAYHFAPQTTAQNGQKKIESKNDTAKHASEAALLKEIDDLLSKKEYHKAGNLLDTLREKYFRTFEYRKTVITGMRILSLKDKINDKALIASSYNTTGLAFWRLGELDSALIFLNEGLKIRLTLTDSASLGKSYNNIGLVYWRKGETEKSYRNYLKALEIREKCGDLQGYVLSLNNIALIYQRLKYYDLAAENINRALKIADSIHFEQGLTYSLRRLGSLSIAQKDYAKAKKYAEQVVAIFKKNSDKAGLAQIYNDLGIIAENSKDSEKAADFFNQSINLARNIQDKFIESFALLNLGRLYQESGKTKEALETLQKARNLAHGGAYSVVLRDVNLQLSKVYEKLGNMKEALAYLNEHVSIKDSIFGETLLSSVGEMRIRYEIEKSTEIQTYLKQQVEAQNRVNFFLLLLVILTLSGTGAVAYLLVKQKKLGELLAIKNDEMALINNKLQESNDELILANETKTKLFSIIAHDLKTPFISILGFTELLKDEILEKNYKDALDFSEKVHTASTKLVELVNNLAGWALLQKEMIKAKPVKLDLEEVSTKVVKEAGLNLALKGIEIESSFEQPTLVYADREMIATVVRNLLTNAVKFSFKGGKIAFNGKVSGKKYKLGIKDEGVGMSEDMIRNILYGVGMISTRGTEDEKGTGLGLSVSRDFMKQNHGSLKIISEQGVGSEFIIELPLADK